MVQPVPTTKVAALVQPMLPLLWLALAGPSLAQPLLLLLHRPVSSPVKPAQVLGRCIALLNF
jgi:hypothetical protein